MLMLTCACDMHNFLCWQCYRVPCADALSAYNISSLQPFNISIHLRLNASEDESLTASQTMQART